MVLKPVPCSTRWEGIAASLWIVLIDLLLVVWMLRRPLDPLRFVMIVVLVLSIPVLVQLIYRTWAAFSLEYWVDRNAVTVHYANVRVVIPLHTIDQIAEQHELTEEGSTLLAWPTPYIRSRLDSSGAAIHQYATQPAAASLMLVSGMDAYLLSPAEPAAFVEAIQERYRLGPTQLLQAERIRLAWWNRWLPDDRLGSWLLVLGLFGVLLLFGVLMISFPNLPDVLAVRYNSAGLPEEVREKTALFRLPVIGLLAWILNGFFGMGMMARRQRAGAYMLWAGAIVVETFSLFALVSLIV